MPFDPPLYFKEELTLEMRVNQIRCSGYFTVSQPTYVILAYRCGKTNILQTNRFKQITSLNTGETIPHFKLTQTYKDSDELKPSFYKVDREKY